ncbi:thioredoxin domain-containing protein [Streptacidiphilus sp. ASG 303]|uniref:thioredoxin domain-containing protein n=1 Tax=Streptacidiphilus sp. ASG 303 TaxID=2896847 RepID=UPI001E30A00A|nr:thioredoxin domain-containing protein [Streptacidiphilus sp. ASG 303]MCD0485767.1 thioredoxin domain-containing protein [Streptacidiphilus sp. ASG 303]
MPNRLADATSPYLLQHAGNPVDWWPWSAEAFDEARRRGVPVLLSVGYAACHWCHVMAHESFEDEAVAAYLNEHFVAVKVDREERPDVDAVYMEAVQAATGQGGWPMTVFLTPDAEPFYFGTYFPPGPRHGMPSFGQVLQGVAAAWQERREEVGEVAGRIAADLAERTSGFGAAGHTAPGEDGLHQALLGLTRHFDGRHGGFGGAPKFPPSMVLEFLLRHHARTGSDAALEMAERTCDAMARGGIHDQLGGGFARYAVDAAWVVPHFEKMLYDNALLLRAYLHLWRATGSPQARRTALDTAAFLLAELRTPEGGFASALDADSPDPATGEPAEGAYYVWTPAQLAAELGEEDGRRAAALFAVTEEGTFEHGASVLQLPEDPDDLPWYESVRARLLAARARRTPPARDDKVVAAWNGLAVAALAEAGALLERPDLLEAALAAADLLLSVHLTPEGRLLRTSRDGRPGPNAGVLEDYADVAEGFLALHAVTGGPEWLQLAGGLLDTVLVHFADPDTGALYDTADDAEQLIRRPQDPTDNAAPSGWTAAAAALLSYAAHTGSERHRTAAERALGVVGALASRAPRFIGWGLAAAEAYADGPREIAVVGPAGDDATALLHRTALLATAPGAVVTVGAPGGTEPGGTEPDGGDTDGGEADGTGGEVPLLRGRPLLGGRPAAYVCRRFTCDAPTADAAELAAAVGAHVQ